MGAPPIVEAFGLTPWLWVVPCPFCGGQHHHSAEPGHRVPHCPPGMEPAGGYVLRYAGPADSAMRAQAERQQGQNRAFLRFLLGTNP
jgi:hypothetical protein